MQRGGRSGSYPSVGRTLRASAHGSCRKETSVSTARSRITLTFAKLGQVQSSVCSVTCIMEF